MRRATLLAVAVLLVSDWATATPSLWQRAKDPRAAAGYERLERAERFMSIGAEFPLSASVEREKWAMVARILTRAAELAPDSSRIAALRAQAVTATERPPEELRLARANLLRALTRDPDSPNAGSGWFSVGIISAKLQDREIERDAYTRSLGRQWVPEQRAVALLNRAESYMLNGQLELAIRDYEESSRTGLDALSYTLSLWGLAVAHERYGDLPTALDYATKVQRIRFPATVLGAASVLDADSVFFVPAYEIYYYKALGAMALAREATKTVDRLLAIETAIVLWSRYLIPAELDKTDWVQNAQRHRTRLERQLAALRAKADTAEGETDAPAPDWPQLYP